MNTFGTLFRITTFGESHGKAIGVVIDGCPAGLVVDMELLRNDMARRRPGQSNIVTRRDEDDEVTILSGVYEGRTLGTPIALLIPNNDTKPADYDHLAGVYRPSHADYTWHVKYGHRDHRGGGRASARETAARVAAGAFAKMLIARQGIQISAYVDSVGDISIGKPYTDLDLSQTETNEVRCPDADTASRMIERILSVRKDGDSIGGTVTCVISGCPAGLGAPVFDKLQATLGHAILSINACKGFEIGSGFSGSAMQGSAHNDPFAMSPFRKVITRTNYSGGVQGGISNGMDIWFRAAFKPPATIMQDQSSIDEQGNPTTVKGRGRHDPCVVPRAVPIVEAMAALVIADALLLRRTDFA